MTDPRCPRCHKKLFPDVGAHESRGDLEIVWRCLHDGYSQDQAPAFAENARKTSALVRQIAAERLRQQRLAGFSRDTGVEVPLVYTDDPVEVADA